MLCAYSRGSIPKTMYIITKVIFFYAVPEDYRAILNATTYATSVTTDDTQSGEPVVSFTIFINNTYFQIPRAIIFQIETTNASIVFEGGEVSDVMIFDGSDPNLDPATVPILKISKPIVYEDTQGVQAGEYEAELTVIVVAREEAGIAQLLESQTSTIQITVTGML